MPINNHKLLLTLKIRHEIGTRKVVQGKNSFGIHFSECYSNTSHCLFTILYAPILIKSGVRFVQEEKI